MASELRIDHLVAKRAQAARPLDPHQEVGAADPSAVEQDSLVDDVRACPQGGLGRACSRDPPLLAGPRLHGNDHDFASSRAVTIEHALLVLDAALLQEPAFELVLRGALESPLRHRDVEHGLVSALGEPAEIRGG